MIYVDAFLPQDGQSAMSLFPPSIQALFTEAARADGNGWRLRGTERQLDLWGPKPGPARDFVRARLSDFSIRCCEQPVSMPFNRAAACERRYIACVGQGYAARPVFEVFADIARRQGWRHDELPTGHACHVEMPEAFARIVLAD